jgi:hypothetical protein
MNLYTKIIITLICIIVALADVTTIMQWASPFEAQLASYILIVATIGVIYVVWRDTGETK